MANKVTFTWNQSALNRVRKGVLSGMYSMATDIHNKAIRNAPVLTGALVGSIRVTPPQGNDVYVLAGGKSTTGKEVRYALYREYHNKAHPSTTHYMGRAFEDTVRGNIAKYFKGKV